MKDIAIFGAGGFGREVACLIRLINESHPEPIWNFVGFFDDGLLIGTNNEYGQVLGGIAELNIWKNPLDIVIAVGNPQIIQKIVEGIDNPNIFFPNVIAPSVVFLDENNFNIGKGNVICSNCLISCNVKIGNFNIFNGFIPIGHDTTIGNYNVIMPSCNISGGVTIGNCNFMGLRSAVLQYIKIGNNVRIGTGSVLMRNAKDGYLYIGIPAQKTDI